MRSRPSGAPRAPSALHAVDTLVFVAIALGLVWVGLHARDARLGDGGLVERRSVLVTDPGTRSPEAALGAEGWAVTDRVGFGYTADTVWIRLDVAPIGEGHVLRVEPGYLDVVDVFMVGPDGRVDALASLGDRRPPTDASAYGPIENVRLPSLDGDASLLLRVRTTSTALVLADVVPEAAYHRGSLLAVALAAFYLLSLLLVAFGAWAERDHGAGTVWAWFFAYLASAGVFSAGTLGLVAVLLPQAPSGTSDVSTSVAILVLMGSGFLLHGSLLARLGFSTALSRGARAMGVVPFVLVAVYLSGGQRTALALNSGMIVVFAALVVATVWGVPKRTVVPPLLVRSVYATIAIMIVVQALPVLGLVPPSRWVAYGAPLAAAPALLLVAWLLLRFRMEIRRIDAEARLAEREALERASFEADQRAGIERFLGYLAETLRASLSVVSVALAGDAPRPRTLALAREAVKDADRVLRRVELLLRIEQDRYEIERVPSDVETVVAETIVRSDLDDRVETVGVEGTFDVDRRVLARILLELLDNATRYGAREAPVVVSWGALGGGRHGVRLQVTSKIGPYASIEAGKAFERYVRGPRARALTGIGLGLFLVRELARRHGGDAVYRDDGATVTVEVTLRS